MDNSDHQDKTIELGKKIARDLGANSRSDFLGGWMAHYVAELIGQYEVASGTEKVEAGRRVSDAIFQIWNHRYKTTSGFDAIKRAGAILETLSQLDPNKKRPFYFAFAPQKQEAERDESEKLKELALGVDRTARQMLRSIVLLQAHTGTNDEMGEYLRLTMPEHLTDDLRAVMELTDEAHSENFAENINALFIEIREFGEFCINFAKPSDSEKK